MKTLIPLFCLFFTFINATLFAQNLVPKTFAYQAVARIADGTPVENEPVNVRMTVIYQIDNSPASPSKSYTVMTNKFGLFKLDVNVGEIDWFDGPYLLQVEIDPNNDGNFDLNGVVPMQAVPYALLAQDVVNKPEFSFTPGEGININNNVISIENGTIPKKLSDLSDVTITVPPNGNQILKYNSDTEKWEVNSDEVGNGTGSENGLNCWDLNGNGIEDINEDRNEDGVFNALDCQGPQGIIGVEGEKGETGLSAYEVWQSQGNNGTITDFISSLKGEKGDRGDASTYTSGDGINIENNVISLENNNLPIKLSDLSDVEIPVTPNGNQILKYNSDTEKWEVNNDNIGNGTGTGEAGQDGLNCWDLNGNGIEDADEDSNGDGIFDALDCLGIAGSTGVQGPVGPAGSNGVDGGTGAQGPRGVNGTNGADGANGDNFWKEESAGISYEGQQVRIKEGENTKVLFNIDNSSGTIFTVGENGNNNLSLSHIGSDSNRGSITISGEEGLANLYFYVDSKDDGVIKIRNENESDRISLAIASNDAGYIDIKGPNGSSNIVLTNLDINNSNNGFIGVYDSEGVSKASMYVNSAGQGGIQRDIEESLIENPNDENSLLAYSSLSGPLVAAYDLGHSKLENGEIFVPYSDHFKIVANTNAVNVLLTPLHWDTYGLAVTQKTKTGFFVKELKGGTGNFSFDWEIKAVRKGHENYQVFRDKKETVEKLNPNKPNSKK